MANQNARRLRRAMSDAERALWYLLRDRRLRGYKFRRQRPVGPFIVDFACIAHCLVIEADGGQHAESETDASRTQWLEAHGWRVLRFWNNEILHNRDGVVETILRAIEEASPSP
jgi:very-short-patch-repair endonuclease